MDMTTVPVHIRDGRVYQVVAENAECVDVKRVQRDGLVWCWKFVYSNGSVLYVPLPKDLIHQPTVADDVTTGPMTA